ncbi:unnamed protein product [Ectocarpus fasciculatus]
MWAFILLPFHLLVGSTSLPPPPRHDMPSTHYMGTPQRGLFSLKNVNGMNATIFMPPVALMVCILRGISATYKIYFCIPPRGRVELHPQAAGVQAAASRAWRHDSQSAATTLTADGNNPIHAKSITPGEPETHSLLTTSPNKTNRLTTVLTKARSNDSSLSDKTKLFGIMHVQRRASRWGGAGVLSGKASILFRSA